MSFKNHQGTVTHPAFGEGKIIGYSKNKNSYIKIKDHLIVLYYNKKHDNWKYSIDNEFCKEVFETRDEAMDAAFEALEMLLSK